MLHFLSPLRLTHRNELVDRPELHVIARALLRRIDLLLTVHGEGPMQLDFPGLVALAEQCRLTEDLYRWFDFERYSARQGRSQRLGGVVGRGTYEGPLGGLVPLLLCGTHVHAGKATTFGFGQYELVILP